MKLRSEVGGDSAAVFAAANSLWEECREAARRDDVDLSEAYNGWDQLMREVMRIGELFENWSCEHVDFEASGEVWPYLLGERFGGACLEVLPATDLAKFNERDCLRVALRLAVPMFRSSNLPLPADLIGRKPVVKAGFEAFRIQTVRVTHPQEFVAPFTAADDPYDPRCSEPIYGIYGISNGELEHICDRQNLSEAIDFVGKLAPGIVFDE